MLWSANRVKNHDASEALTHWTNVSNVSVVSGGIEGGSCFKFEPTASMQQAITVAGQPPELLFRCMFLPGQDVHSGAKTRSEVEFIITYGDGTQDTYVIPVRAFN